MSLVPVFNAIKTQLEDNVATVPPFTKATNPFVGCYVQMWNNQLKYWRQQAKKGEDIKSMYSINFPALLVEFRQLENEEMGNGVQIYPNLLVRIHIVHQQLDATTGNVYSASEPGTMEQNLDIYILQEAVQAALNKFKITNCVEFIRKNHGLDNDHDVLYHYTVDYMTNYTDYGQQEPVGGVTISGGTLTPEITETYNPSPFLKP